MATGGVDPVDNVRVVSGLDDAEVALAKSCEDPGRRLEGGRCGSHDYEYSRGKPPRQWQCGVRYRAPGTPLAGSGHHPWRSQMLG
jgi:hypothetical protein